MTRWIAASISLTAAALAVSLSVYRFEYNRLPDRVPVHWNIHGRPDGWTPKDRVLPTFLLMPAIMAGIISLTLALPWLSPKQFEVDQFRDTYGYIMALVVALMGYIHLAILWGSVQREHPPDVGRWIIGGAFLFLMLMGNVLGKVRRNFWIGVRTPWTLASDRVWIATHRLTAWLLVAAGLLGFAATLAGVPPLWSLSGLFAALLVPAVYSLILYKRLERQGVS